MPPSGGPGAVEFTAGDYSRLAPDEYLNDTSIDFYLRYVQEELTKKRPEDAARCYFFNSFFYKKLSEKSGGDLPEDLDTSTMNAKDKQALRNFQKVRKWTRDVDIFSKDYIFVPIHDALHWSLVVICHPGANIIAAKKSRSRGGPRKRAHVNAAFASTVIDGDGIETEGTDPRASPKPEAFMLHLDSIRGAHASSSYATILQQYLQAEWDSKVKEHAPSVPQRWAAEHSNEEDGAPAAIRSFKSLTIISPKVPSQDHYCDCGLFVCAFVDFFAEAMPPALNLSALEELGKEFDRDGRDLWEPSSMEFEEPKSKKYQYYPGFLTQCWFPAANASRLRWEMSRMVLTHMAVSRYIIVFRVYG